MRDAWWYLGATLVVAFLAVGCWLLGGWILRGAKGIGTMVHPEEPKDG